jgi:hypothetical protein
MMAGAAAAWLVYSIGMRPAIARMQEYEREATGSDEKLPEP